MDIEAVQRAYRRYAQLYDVYFGLIFQPGRKAILQRMDCRPGEHILEVGVGTGMSLPLYPHATQVTGIDISHEMLARARARKQRYELDNVLALQQMDAENMDYPDNSFDKVTAMYVASVVPSPERLVNEMRRVCKPDGELFIVNHFAHKNVLVGGMERLIAPLSKVLGFRPDFSLEEFIADTGLDVVEQSPVNLFGYWTLLRASNNKSTLAGRRPMSASA